MVPISTHSVDCWLREFSDGIERFLGAADGALGDGDVPMSILGSGDGGDGLLAEGLLFDFLLVLSDLDEARLTAKPKPLASCWLAVKVKPGVNRDCKRCNWLEPGAESRTTR